MRHWTEKYLGRPWIRDEYDCSDMVREVVMDLRGFDVPLPGERRWSKMQPDEIRAFTSAFSRPTDNPADGDAVIMKIMGHRRTLGGHVGIYAVSGGMPWVLHNLSPCGVIFTPVADLSRHSLDLVGYYEWIAC